MSLSDANSWFGIAGGAVGVLTFLYLVWDSFKKRRRLRLDESAIVTTNAIQLMEQLRQRANDLEEQLDEANQRASDLSAKLNTSLDEAAELRRQHGTMAEALTNAQAEVRVLRLQVKNLSETLDRRSNWPENQG